MKWRSCHVRRLFGQPHTISCHFCASYRSHVHQGDFEGERATSKNGVAPFVLPIKLRSGVLEPPPGYTRGSQPRVTW